MRYTNIAISKVCANLRAPKNRSQYTHTHTHNNIFERLWYVCVVVACGGCLWCLRLRRGELVFTSQRCDDENRRRCVRLLARLLGALAAPPPPIFTRALRRAVRCLPACLPAAAQRIMWCVINLHKHSPQRARAVTAAAAAAGTNNTRTRAIYLSVYLYTRRYIYYMYIFMKNLYAGQTACARARIEFRAESRRCGQGGTHICICMTTSWLW